MFASEDLNAGLKVITVRCAYLQCNYKLLYTMVLVRNGTPGIQGEVTNIQSSNTLHRIITHRNSGFPQWGKNPGRCRSEYHPGGENKINKEQGEGGKREKEKKREDNKQANEPRRTPSLSHDCSLHWRLARYGFSSETWKAFMMCMLRGQRLHASRDGVNLNLASISYGTTKTCGQFLRFCLNRALVRSHTFCLGV